MPESMAALRDRAKVLGVPTPFGIKKEDLIIAIQAAEKEQGLVAETVEDIQLGTKLSNPELEPVKMSKDVISGNESDEQRRAKLEQEIREKIEREEIERRLRIEAARARQREAQANKYTLQYDITDLKNRAEAMLGSKGLQFRIDTRPDGSLAGTYHMFGKGKENCGNLAQPLDTIMRDIRLFCGVKTLDDVPKIKAGEEGSVRSTFTGQPMDTPVHIVGQSSSARVDIADVSVV